MAARNFSLRPGFERCSEIGTERATQNHPMQERDGASMSGAMTTFADFISLEGEQRRTARRSLNLRVEMRGEASATQLCSARNISFSGMFLQCTPGFGRVGEVVGLEFSLNFGGLNRRCGMRVQIVWVAAEGIGVCFHTSDAVSFRYIQKMMYERSALQGGQEPGFASR